MSGPPVVVLDVETTGLSAYGGDRVVELGLVRLDGELRVEQEYSTLVNPERPMGASNIHGIRDADVQDAPTFADIAGDVGEFCAGAVFAAHNASFDIGFLFSEFEHAGLAKLLPSEEVLAVIDTLALSRRLVVDVPNYKLTTVCEACGVPPWTQHGALGDAKATAQLLARLALVNGGLSMSTLTCMLKPGWTGLKPSGLAHPRKTLATMAGAVNGRPTPADRPPPLAGEVAVFTGGVGIARDEAVRVAGALGCMVRPAVTGKTTIVVVGDPDVGRLGPHVGMGATGKHREALERAAAGQRLRVLDEAAFMRLAEVVSDGVITEEEWSAVRELVYSVKFAARDDGGEPMAKPRRGRREATANGAAVLTLAPPLSEPAPSRQEPAPTPPPEPQAGEGHACKTAGCTNLTSTAARQYCDLCRELRAAPNAYRDGDIMGEKLFFGVAGVGFRPAGGDVRVGDPLYLVRDPDNEHDPLAIEVRRENGDLIGYVPREKPLQGKYGWRLYRQGDLAKALDAGSRYTLRAYAVDDGVLATGSCDGWLVPHPARLERWAERGGDFGKPREPPPFEVARAPEIAEARPRSTSGSEEPAPEVVSRTSALGLWVVVLVGLVGLAIVWLAK